MADTVREETGVALTPVKIEVLTGPQGGGKSETMRRETIATAGLYLFALPIKDLIDEQAADFARDNPTLYTVKVYSESGKPATAKQLDEARRDIETRGLTSAVIFTTHSTLMDHPLAGFDQWNIRIDEAPAAVQAGRFNIAVSHRQWLKENFELVSRDGDPWSIVQLKSKKPNWAAIQRDTGAEPLAEFIKQAAQPSRAFVKAKTWDEGDDIAWFSMWSPIALSHCKTIQVAGSGYTNSIGFLTAKSLYSDLLNVSLRKIAPPRSAQPDIRIHFFTRGHHGSTTFWATDEGLKTLVPVTDFLATALPSNSFWSGNPIVRTVMMGRLKGEFIRPLAAGLNKYREAAACAILFSSKALDEDKPLMDVFDMTKADIEAAREGEAIAQFVMRGAIRNLDYSGAYDIYLHSEKQAKRLGEHLEGIGFTNVALVPEDQVGIMSQRRLRGARTIPNEEELAARAAAKLKRNAVRQKEARRKKAIAEGRTPSANGGKGGRPAKNQKSI